MPQCRMRLLLPCMFAVPLVGPRLWARHSNGPSGAQSANPLSTTRRPSHLEKLLNLIQAGGLGAWGGVRNGSGEWWVRWGLFHPWWELDEVEGER